MQQEIKLVLVGDGDVGKSTLVERLCNRSFDSIYSATLGVEVYPWGNYIIWDTAGKEKFGGLRDGYYINANLAIIMVDATSEITAKSIKNWYSDLKRATPNVKIGILVNKIDCNININAILYASEFAKDKDLQYMEITCKDKFNIRSFKIFLEDIARY